MQIKIFEKFEEKVTFVENYFRSIGDSLFINALDDFSKKTGFGREPFCNIFHNEYQEWEEGYFGETGVKFVAFYPALDIEEQAIVSNSEFYEMICKEAERYVNINVDNKGMVYEKLQEIKNALEL